MRKSFIRTVDQVLLNLASTSTAALENSFDALMQVSSENLLVTDRLTTNRFSGIEDRYVDWVGLKMRSCSSLQPMALFDATTTCKKTLPNSR